MNKTLITWIAVICFFFAGAILLGLLYLILIRSQQHETPWYIKQGAYCLLFAGVGILLLLKSHSTNKKTLTKEKSLLAVAMILCSLWAIAPAHAQGAAKIQDNSFLIEEAYNQEAGVVQHIGVVLWDPEAETWDFSFTQEWPVLSQDHQFSYTVPISKAESDTGLADVLLNYRYQAVFREGVAFSPRGSLLLPTGDTDDGLGTGALGYQINLPLSVELNERWVMHWNLGATFIPESKIAGGDRADNTGFNYGASFIYLASTTFNLMLEFVGTSDEVTTGHNQTQREESVFISPGVRYAINCESGLQIVPGLAVPVGIGPSEGEYGLIGYISFEHGF